MRTIRALLASLALLTFAVTPAFAGGKPDISLFENPAQFLFDAGDPCAFPLEIDTLIQKEYGITFFDADGNPTRTLIHGRLVMKVTNLDSGASFTLNESGPGEFIYNADGTITFHLRGQSILFPPSLPLYDHSGPMTILIGTDGTPTLVDQLGHGVNLCPLLG